MRLFAALVPDDNALDALARSVAAARRGGDGLRWSSREQWHVTLVFLGEVPPEQGDRVRRRLARAVERHRAMTLGLGGAGTFPANPARARVLWARLTGDTAALTGLAADLRGTAADSGIAVEERGYTPHLTVARSRRATDLSAPYSRLAALTAGPWRADEVHLVRSLPGTTPRYRTVSTWGLA